MLFQSWQDRNGIPPPQKGLHVLVISNHWGLKASFPWAGIFADRQIGSLQKAGVRISTFDIGHSLSPLHILKKWSELRRLVRNLNPDIVHGRSGTVVGFTATFSGKPAVITFIGGDLLGGPSVSSKARQYGACLLSNLAALRAQALICVSGELRQALWWRKSRATIIPDGVDLDFFSPGPQEIARKQLGWGLRHPIVIMNIRNNPRLKGLDLAMKALQAVRVRLPETELHLIENVEPDRMPLYYRAADVLLCASAREGSPNVVKEALACNLPVVSTPVGDVPERLVGVEPSAVVVRDATAIGGALVNILLERKRSNGRQHVATLNLQDIAQRIQDVYRSALHNMPNK